MTGAERRLPEGFSDLEVFVDDWALATEGERYDKRERSSYEDIVQFYEALVPRAEAAVAYLDGLALDALTPDAKRLMYLLFSLATISFSVETWKQPKVPDSGNANLLSEAEPLPI